MSPIEAMKQTFGDNFYYILYFQEPGVAEEEFDADPRAILSRLYSRPTRRANRRRSPIPSARRAAGFRGSGRPKACRRG